MFSRHTMDFTFFTLARAAVRLALAAAVAFPVTVGAGGPVEDTLAPVLSCPGGVVSTCAGASGTMVFFVVQAVDDLDPVPTLRCVPAPGSPFPPGRTLVTCVASDSAGNESSCSFPVTVLDGVPPMITCPGDFQIEPGAPSGEPFASRVRVADHCDPAPSVVCSPPNAALLPIGTIQVTCVATDVSGSQTSCAFNVRVIDSLAPRVSCPGLIEVRAETLGGAVLTFIAGVEDLGDPDPTLNCVPPSGARFPIGTTVVTCTGSDATGNSASCSFNVSILPFDGNEDPLPGGMILALGELIRGLELPAGLENSLVSKLEAALASVEKGEGASASGALGGLIHHVEAQLGKKLTDSGAESIIAAANAILFLIAEEGAAGGRVRDTSSPVAVIVPLSQTSAAPAHSSPVPSDRSRLGAAPSHTRPRGGE